MTIRQLSDIMINQIAAGEVVERPASVVKELVENALDAGARRIEIVTAGGGLSLVRVTDDGCGIGLEELPLAIARHCTSKLGDDIHDIRSLGFRGEALPSIGSVGRLTLRSRTADASEASEIVVDCGHVSLVRPAAANPGTVVEVRELFRQMPARLKFMRGERAEAGAITDVVRRIAVAFPMVRFTLTGTDRTATELPAAGDTRDHAAGRNERIAQVLGPEFIANAVEIDANRDGVNLTGLASIAAYNRGNAQHQYVYVNGRPIRDRMIAGAIRGAYADVLPRDRHPVATLFITIDPALVDVNVHPNKADVRFRDPGLVRGLIVGSIREALARSGVRAATDGASAMLARFRAGAPAGGSAYDLAQSPHRPLGDAAGFAEALQQRFTVDPGPSADARASAPSAGETGQSDHPLGAARAQIHENYIVSQTNDSLIIVDQHAAHERLVYEALKQAFDSRPAPVQMLLLPDIVDLSEDDADRIGEHAATLSRLGLELERFGPGAVMVRGTPAMLGEADTAALVRDIADEIAEGDTADSLRQRLDRIAATMACHGSVRSGRRLRPEEMNALLRQMEAVPGSGTCNHGRPTYIELKLSDIERLFGRR